MILITTCPATKEGWYQENPVLKREKIEITNPVAFIRRGKNYGVSGWEFHFFNEPFDGGTFWYFCEGDIISVNVKYPNEIEFNKHFEIINYNSLPVINIEAIF